MSTQIPITNTLVRIEPGPEFSLAFKAAVDAKLDELKSPLNLTPEQETAIRAALTQKMNAFFGSLADRMGFYRLLEQDKFNRTLFVFACLSGSREMIKPILKPQQLAAFDVFEDQQRKCRAEALASAQLQRLQAPLRLDEDQSVQVFGIFNEQAQRQFALAGGIFVAAPRAETQAKTDQALQNVLTPLQFEQYQRLQKQQQAKPTQQQSIAEFLAGLFAAAQMRIPR